MEEKTYTLNICRTGTYQYEVTKPEIGVTKTAAILDNALNITLHDILKHFTARSLILVFANQHIDRDCRNVEPQEYPQTAYKVTQMSIVSQVERSERELF